MPPVTPMPQPNIPTFLTGGANVTQNPLQKINEPIPQSIINKFQTVASNPNPFALQKRPAPFMPRFNLPKMQSFGSPRMATGELNIDQGYLPQRMAGGGSLDMALQNLKSKLNG